MPTWVKIFMAPSKLCKARKYFHYFALNCIKKVKVDNWKEKYNRNSSKIGKISKNHMNVDSFSLFFSKWISSLFFPSWIHPPPTGGCTYGQNIYTGKHLVFLYMVYYPKATNLIDYHGYSWKAAITNRWLGWDIVDWMVVFTHCSRSICFSTLHSLLILCNGMETYAWR